MGTGRYGELNCSGWQNMEECEEGKLTLLLGIKC